MTDGEAYYRVLAKERGAKLQRIHDLIVLGRSLQASPDVILDNVLAIILEHVENSNFLSDGVK